MSKEVRFSEYEIGLFERYLCDYITMKEIMQDLKRGKWNDLEYDKAQVKILLERLHGKNYKPNYEVTRSEYLSSMYYDESDPRFVK